MKKALNILVATPINRVRAKPCTGGEVVKLPSQ